MCRFLGAVSSEVADYQHFLTDAPRSLAALSSEHPHGWGIAVHEGRDGWALHRSPTCAREDACFRSLASAARGKLIIAHIRKRTVGSSRLMNTHPFRRDPWMFAHNGTMFDTAYLTQRTSRARMSEVEGDTDSELFFAYLLTALDEAGAASGVRRSVPGLVDRVLSRAVTAALARPDAGAANFLLSDGEVLYAHRFGRTLHLSDRGFGDGTSGGRRPAVLIASEPVTDEPWYELAERTLVRVDGGIAPRWAFIPRTDRAVASYPGAASRQGSAGAADPARKAC